MENSDNKYNIIVYNCCCNIITQYHYNIAISWRANTGVVGMCLCVHVFIKHVCLLWCVESRDRTGKQSVCTVKATLTVLVPEGLRGDVAMIKNKAALRQTTIQPLTVKTPDIAEQWRIQNAAAGWTWDYQIKSKIVVFKDQSICWIDSVS